MASIEEYEMEREFSYFLFKEEKEKQASVKMDLEICELYFKVIEELLSGGDRENNIEDIRECLSLISCLTDSQSQNNQTSSRIMSRRQIREILSELKRTFFYKVLYIYWNSTCFSSAVARHFQKFLVERSYDLKELLSKKIIRFCSFGGRCLSDVIAMIKVLESIDGVKEYIHIRVSVIYIDEGWRNICLTVLQRLKHFHNATWKIDFIQADLNKPFSNSVQEMIKNADIISMVMFLPEMKDVFLGRKLFFRLQKLVRPGSILFFLDSACPRIFNFCGGISGKMLGYCLLYEAVYDLHTLDETVVERQFHLFNGEYNFSWFHTYIMVFSRIWVRVHLDHVTETSLKPLNEKFIRIETSLKEKEIQLQKISKEYKLLRKSEMNRFQAWEISVIQEMGRERRKKEEFQKTLDHARTALLEELKVKKNDSETSIKERLMEEKQQFEEMKANLESCIAVQRKRAFSMLDSYEQSVRELFLKLEEKYPFRFTEKI